MLLAGTSVVTWIPLDSIGSIFFSGLKLRTEVGFFQMQQSNGMPEAIAIAAGWVGRIEEKHR